jgi:2',3'-cyclic-nucleotide 2'-phosphodiesterase (5'-nucleotidase family)
VGGVARRATVLIAERASSPNFLLLDAGDALFGQQVANESKGGIAIAAMNLMGYTAMTLGPTDLQAGLSVLRDRAAEARFPFLGANLPTDFPSQPYVLVNIGSRDIAILGLTNAETPLIPAVGGSIAVGDPLEAARRWVPVVRQQTNVILVLSNLGKQMDQRLAREVPGITAIIGGHDREFLQPPLQVGRTVIGQAGFNGEGLGLLRLEIDSSGTVTTSAGEIRYLRAEIPDDRAMRSLIGPPVLPPGY